MIRSRPRPACDPEPHWTPVRTVRADVECSFCNNLILRTAPGRRTGERGTKAFYNAVLREWECIPCRIEAGRANEERNK